MQLWVCCALLVFAAGGCLAQKPRPCRSPPLLEGSFNKVAQNGDYLAFGNYSYDAQLQRIRLGKFVQAENHTDVLGALLLYQEKVVYRMDYLQQTCKKQALTSEFHPLEIPSNASFLGQVVIGSLSAPNEGVLVNTWAGEVPKVQGQYVMTFTEFGCLPVSALYRKSKTDLMVYSSFDITLGIKDSSVFVPPPFCQNATLEAGEGDFFSVFF